MKDKEEVEQEKEELEKATDTLRGNIAILEQTKRELLQKVSLCFHLQKQTAWLVYTMSDLMLSSDTDCMICLYNVRLF